MNGSWAGAMGHTQWMPEVWLNVGLDFDGDGRVSPFGSPADALASTARYLVTRGKYRRGELWGYEVKGAAVRRPAHVRDMASRRRPPRRRQGLPRSGCHGAAVDAGARRARVPDRAELRRRAQLQSVEELHAGDPASQRPAARRRAVRAALPRRRAHADDRRTERIAAAPDQRRLTTPAASTAGSATTPCGRCAPIRRRSAWSPPTAMPGSRCWHGCGREPEGISAA